MAKNKTSFICQACGSVSSRWQGKCEACGGWNTVVEERAESALPASMAPHKRGQAIQFQTLENAEDAKTMPRMVSGIAEFDRATGGGLVPGSALLLGGDPGIGKSTLLLQAVCALANRGKNCVYISGEESAAQVRLRAERLGLAKAPVQLANANQVRDIMATLDDPVADHDVVIIDSIQTMYLDTVDSAPGTVTQVRIAAHEIIRVAKKRNICVIFVGHVTKDGQIAGPRVVEHMVDAVLYFEGERGHAFRILRAVKNRFGPANEIGVFDMQGAGLVEVPNPSALFLPQREEAVTGSAILAALEGTRPLLAEVQGLIVSSQLATPRRAVVGWDSARLSMILAVLEARAGISFSNTEVYLNMAGGLDVSEPAADLAVAAALISAHTNVPAPHDCVFFGEIGLSGEVRPVPQAEIRLNEAKKLGFKRAIAAKDTAKNGTLPVTEITHINDLLALFPQTGRKMKAV